MALKMLVLFVISLSTFYINRASAQGECTDVRGRLISHGLHYVPGPDTCTLCICGNGQAKHCKAVLCSPPQDCRSFRVGNTCCEFICLDDVVKPAEPTDPSISVAAVGAFAIVVMTLILVVYNIRKQKRRRTPHTDDQRSMTSIGYISGSMAYVGGTCETGFAAWKPPSNYMPRGEAPPPYDEAVAQSRAETMRMAEQALHRSYPATVESLSRDDGLQCAPHPYGNMPRPIAQMPNPQNCYNAPLLQPVHQVENRELSHQIPHHMLAPNVGFPSAVRLTGSLGAISGRGLSLREPPPDRPHHVPGFYTPAVHTSVHRTIPRISTAVDTTLLDTSLSGFSRADRSLQNEIRRSFHKPADSGRHAYDTGRSMPRNLNFASEGGALVVEGERVVGRARAFSDEHAPTAPRSEPDPPEPAPSHTPHTSHASVQPHPPMTSHPPPPQPQSTLPLTADKPSCVCSYEGPSAPGTEDADDYRSECENCKSVSSSRWVLEEGWRAEAGGGTQTLQRRAPPAAPPPATHTLPQPVTKQRTVMGPPSNWENWFNTIPDSDTESEEE